MHRPRFLSLLFIVISVPGIIYAQDIIRTSRYDRADMPANSSDKIDVLRERYNIPSRSLIISPSFGDDIILAVRRTDLKGEEGPSIKTESHPVLFTDDAFTAYYMLFRKEPSIIGEHAYSFDVDGNRYQIHYVKNGSVITKAISANEMFLAQDNYMLKVLRPEKHE